ncbi:hypothetical protein Bbelb_388770 [Branchiostoma belcheri]|nr:hypothetical protein Bbelb_388770 [Branchiostoma belcheri]
MAGDYNRLDYKPLALAHRLDQVVNTPTRGDATLDVILTNLKSLFDTPVVTNPIGTSDHRAVWWQPRSGPHMPNKTKEVVVRPLRDSGIRALGQWITTHNWSEVLQCESVEAKTVAFYSTLNSAIEAYFPLMSTYLKNLIHRRQHAYSNGHMVLYRFLRNKVDRECKRAKKEFYRDHVDSLKKTDPSEWRKQVRRLANLSKPASTVHVPGVNQSDICTGTVAGAINGDLATICQALPPLDRDKLPAFLPTSPPPQIEPWQMYHCLKKVKVRKAPGPDAIPPTLIKEFAYELATPLTDIMNASLQQGSVPPEWRDAIVIPVPKEQPADLDKIRPVSLTSQFAKVAEGFVLSWLLRDIMPSVDMRQFGNIKGVSTTHCLVEILDFLFRGAENKQSVSNLVLTDFSKAFDRVCHTTAITKLVQMGARPSLDSWVCSFISHRTQRVRYQQVLSDREPLTCGVAQGTLLGPLIFLAMINDAGTPNSEYWKYVDDLNLGENRPICSPSSLQNDLNNLDEWSDRNHMLLNPKKCKVLQICFMKTPPPDPVLTLGGQTLSVVKQARQLGIQIQSDLGWDSQVDSMVSKGSKRLFFLCRLRRAGLPPDDLCAIYCGYVRPLLEYAVPVWNAALNIRQVNRLERVQKRACRIMLGRHYTTYMDALQTLNLQTLSDRRHDLCLNFATKIRQSSRFRSWLPSTKGQLHGRSLRNSLHYCQAKGTKRYTTSAIPALAKLLVGLQTS